MPQCAVLVDRFTQAPEHTVGPLGHVHAPATQDAPIGHTFPHPPQLTWSVFVSTHEEPHAVRPAGQ